jgi:hypothetical protein
MHFHEVVITPFIASAVARGGIGDPTTMLAYGAVEVEAARTIMGTHGRRFNTGACLFVSSLLQPQFLGCYSPKRLGKKHAQEGLEADGCGIQTEAAVPAHHTDALRHLEVTLIIMMKVGRGGW